MPIISVIIPVYNCENYLKECLESVIKQTFQEIEIICINDGSTDNSLKILQEYAKKDNRIIVIDKENSGAGDSRNVGLNKAQGKYLYFLDSDDFLLNTCLEDLYLQAEKNQSEICLAKYNMYNNNSKTYTDANWSLRTWLLPDKINFAAVDISDKIFQICIPNIFLKLYRKDYIEKNNIKFQNIKTCNDVLFDFLARAYAKNITYIDKVVMSYRQDTKSSITTTRGNYWSCILLALQEVKTELEINNLFNTFKNSFYKECIECFKYELSKCDEIQAKKATDSFKNFLPEDFQEIFLNELYQANSNVAKINTDRAHLKLLNIVKNNKNIAFWGASIFLEEFLNKYDIDKSNIIGIIDNNPTKNGTKINQIPIFSAVNLKNIGVENIVLTVKNNNQIIYENIKQYLVDNYSNIKLLSNIFLEKNTLETNKIYKLNINGEKEAVSSISGIDIIFEGENSVIEIEESPMTIFKNCAIKCGTNCYIKFSSSKYTIHSLYVDITANGSKFIVGKDFSCNRAKIILHDEPNLEIHIGDDCMFAHDIMLRSSDGHTIYDIDTKEILNKPEQTSIEIGNHVWVGHGVTILKNSKVSDNTIIGKSALVNKKFNETNIILAGVPAKITKRKVNWDRKHTYAFNNRK